MYEFEINGVLLHFGEPLRRATANIADKAVPPLRFYILHDSLQGLDEVVNT